MQYSCDTGTEVLSPVHVLFVLYFATKDDRAITHRERRKCFVPDKCGVKMIREGSYGPIAENKRCDALLMLVLFFFCLLPQDSC